MLPAIRQRLMDGPQIVFGQRRMPQQPQPVDIDQVEQVRRLPLHPQQGLGFSGTSATPDPQQRLVAHVSHLIPPQTYEQSVSQSVSGQRGPSRGRGDLKESLAASGTKGGPVTPDAFSDMVASLFLCTPCREAAGEIRIRSTDAHGQIQAM